MRWLVVAGLAVVALAAALWVMLNEPEAAPAPSEKPEKAGPVERTAPEAAAPGGEGPQRSAAPLVAAARKSQPVRSVDDPPPPNLDALPEAAGSAKKERTEQDRWRHRIARAVHDTEPQVLECLEAAKERGENIDGASTYGTVISLGDDGKVMVHSSTREYGPYGDTLNTCLMDTAKAIQLDELPGGAQKLHVFRKITVENGQIKNYQIPAFRPVD